jgi:hypothetical protein
MTGSGQVRPPGRPLVNRDTSLYSGLLSMVAGGWPQDLVQGNTLTGDLTRTGWGGVGGAISQFNVGGAGMRGPTPPACQIGFPVTLATRAVFLGTPSSAAETWAFHYTNADTAPYVAYDIGVANNTGLALAGNSAGTFYAFESGVIPTFFKVCSLIATFAAGTQKLYLDGVLLGGFSAGSDPTFGSNSLYCAGDQFVANNRNSNELFIHGMFWNRLLSDNERAMLDFERPYDLYWQPSFRAYNFKPAAVTAGPTIVVTSTRTIYHYRRSIYRKKVA